jgi:hypothetical protein
LRLMTTAAPKINVSNAKIQNRNGDISDPGLRISDCGFVGSSVVVPFQHDVVHHSADCRVILNEVKDLAIEAFANE